MTGAEVLDVAREAIWASIVLSGPVMLAGLVVGVAVALVQALTQIQEMTLVFVPKIVTVFVALMIALPYMGAVMARLTEQLFLRIVGV